MLALMLAATVSVAAQDSPGVATATPRQWRTPAGLDAAVTGLPASYSSSVELLTIGTSLEGRPIRAIRLALAGDVPVDDRSAVLLVAGIDGDHLLGSEVAVEIASSLLARAGDGDENVVSLLRDHALHIVPQVNPDGAARYFDVVRSGHRENMRSDDADRDGAVDEDGGDDLNGDGYVTWMRVPDLERANRVAHPDEPRLDKTPEPLEGQAATFIVYREGIDNDGDGLYNEDGVGGVDLNQNFVHGYRFHAAGSGAWQLSEPESRALIDYVLAHQEIALVLVYGRHDTLVSAPKDTAKDPAGAPRIIAAGDVALHAKVAERFGELTGLKTSASEGSNGAFFAWSYAQFGVPTFATSLWSRPPADQSIDQDDAKGDDTQADRSRGGPPRDADRPRGGPGGRGNFDWEAMRGEYDTNKDGELDDDERDAMREAMRERFGGRGGSGGRRGGPRAGGPPDGAQEEGEDLTPSGIGTISQETIDELLAAAAAQGFEITDAMMEGITEADIEQYAKWSEVEIRRVSPQRGTSKADSEEAKWLAYSDEVRGGSGFIEWTPFEHPQLGPVEIGGFVPYFRTLPPTSEITGIAEAQVAFLLDMAKRLPSVRIGDIRVEALGGGLWRVKAPIINDGWLPAGTAMAAMNKRARPLVVRLELPNDRIVSGRRVDRIWSLPGSGTRRWHEWIITGSEGDPLVITLYSEKYGTETAQTTLAQDGGDA